MIFAIKSGGGVYLSSMFPVEFCGTLNEEGDYINNDYFFNSLQEANKVLDMVPKHYNARIVKIKTVVVYREIE